MHTIALQLAPILGAEKSKVPFYIAGGLLVAWALVLSLVIGARNKDFPATLSQQRGVIAVTAILVLAAVSMAVVTSGGSKSETTASAAPQSTTETQSAPAETTSSQTTSASTATTPTATTGTPAPATSPAATTSLKLAANPEGQLSYDTKALSAKAGTVTVTMTNMSPVEHDVAIAEGSKTLGATPVFSGGSKTVTVKLKPGKYTFFCTVPGHRQAGMEGTLTVS
jgi:uncharacterized cupredoxin-like copper-binding protein